MNTHPQNQYRLRNMLIWSTLFITMLSSCEFEYQNSTPSFESFTHTPVLIELTTTAVSVSPQEQASGIKSPTPTVELAEASPSSVPLESPSHPNEISYLSSILSGVKIVDEPNQLVFLDSNDEILWMTEDRYSDLTFDPSGCFLFSGWSRGQYAELSKLSLKGQVLDTKSITYDENLKTPDEAFGFLPSPTGDFLAYMVGSGEGGRGPADAEFLDVGLIDFRDDRSSKPAMLTSNGGGPTSGSVWSSDGQYLAFSDFDENGIVQILVYGIEEERTYQLSNFGEEMRNWEISDLIWSPDGTKVAFSAFRKKVEQNADPAGGILEVKLKKPGISALDLSAVCGWIFYAILGAGQPSFISASLSLRRRRVCIL